MEIFKSQKTVLVAQLKADKEALQKENAQLKADIEELNTKLEGSELQAENTELLEKNSELAQQIIDLHAQITDNQVDVDEVAARKAAEIIQAQGIPAAVVAKDGNVEGSDLLKKFDAMQDGPEKRAFFNEHAEALKKAYFIDRK